MIKRSIGGQSVTNTENLADSTLILEIEWDAIQA